MSTVDEYGPLGLASFLIHPTPLLRSLHHQRELGCGGYRSAPSCRTSVEYLVSSQEQSGLSTDETAIVNGDHSVAGDIRFALTKLARTTL
jgi:hypothetical protein